MCTISEKHQRTIRQRDEAEREASRLLQQNEKRREYYEEVEEESMDEEEEEELRQKELRAREQEKGRPTTYCRRDRSPIEVPTQPA